MCILLIINIPSSYFSKDIRYYFSEFIECKAFECFHYRHRKLSFLLKEKVIFEKYLNNDVENNVMCAFCEIKSQYKIKFIQKYNNIQWHDYNNNISDYKVRIIELDKNIKNEIKGF